MHVVIIRERDSRTLWSFGIRGSPPVTLIALHTFGPRSLLIAVAGCERENIQLLKYKKSRFSRQKTYEIDYKIVSFFIWLLSCKMQPRSDLNIIIQFY